MLVMKQTIMKSPIPRYYGGKSSLAKRIVDRIEKESWKIYVESFCGGASVFWGLDKTVNGRKFIINDKDSRIMNFWDVIQNCSEEFMDMIESRSVVSRELHQKAKECFETTAGVHHGSRDVELAWSLWYLIRFSFCGMLVNASFDKTARTPKNLMKGMGYLPDIIKQMRYAVIENDVAEKVIKYYDCPDAFHYLDPPYVGTTQKHYRGYSQENFNTLLDCCESIKGKFMLSHYKNDELDRRIEKNGWNITSIDTSCTIGKMSEARTEILVSNFESGKNLV